MLNNKIEQDELFIELNKLARNMGFCVVDVVKSLHPNNTDVAIVISSQNGDTTIEALEDFHRAVQPFLELKFSRDELSMSVSTPGLQRQFKDFYEFKVFKGKNVRLYSLKDNVWVNGIISDVNEVEVRLVNAKFEDASKQVSIEEKPIEEKSAQESTIQNPHELSATKHDPQDISAVCISNLSDNNATFDYTINYADIQKAKLDFSFNEEKPSESKQKKEQAKTKKGKKKANG